MIEEKVIEINDNIARKRQRGSIKIEKKKIEGIVEQSHQYIVVSSRIHLVMTTCHIIYLPTDQVLLQVCFGNDKVSGLSFSHNDSSYTEFFDDKRYHKIWEP